MTEIRLHNSLTRRKEVFEPINPDNVRMYVCGPTVYDRAHIGNARPVVVFDVLYRLLRHVYGADHVTYVRNITDIDDKINARGPQDFPDLAPLEAIRRVTDMTSGWFVEDMRALGALDPTHQPRATEYVPQMIAMIEELIAKGFAYAAEGHVLFEVAKYDDYGKLSGRSTDDMIAGARVEVAPYKRDPMDFVLWKPSDDDTPGWDSPWGRGRPGWHIECSAMSSELLGETFDIHGGGSDLMFPHHENEIAQSCCASPDAGFAKVWMHNGMINVDGRKMSKSLGNFLTVAEVGEIWRDFQPFGQAARLVLLSTHCRGVLDWTEDKFRQCVKSLLKWRDRTVDWHGSNVELPAPSETLIKHLSDDLNTPAAIAWLHELAGRANAPENHSPSATELEASQQLLADLHFLGLEPERVQVGVFPAAGDVTEATIDALLVKRAEAREAKDFATADAIRKGLDEAGVVVIDQKGGPSEWKLGPDFHAAKLEALK